MDKLKEDISLSKDSQPYCLIIPGKGNMAIHTNGCYGKNKKGRPPAPNTWSLSVGDMFVLSWNSLHRIVATGNEEIEWLQISIANCEEYLMHNDYLEKSTCIRKRKRDV